MGALRDSGAGAEVASKTLFTAASAANAIPVAGQFVSAGLAIAGLFTKIFGGRRRRKRAAEQAARDEASMNAKGKMQGFSNATSATNTVGGSVNSGQAAGAHAPITQPQAASFNSWGGGSAPSVQQSAINSAIGMK